MWHEICSLLDQLIKFGGVFVKRTKQYWLLVFLLCHLGCGQEEALEEQEVIVMTKVELQLPELADTAEFWRGVKLRELVWKPNDHGEEVTFEVSAGLSSAVDLSVGGDLLFHGRGQAGSVLVYGKQRVAGWEVTSPEPKIIVIYVMRQEYN